MEITIQQGQGITQAIKAKIQENGGTITNNSASIWSQVLNEVQTSANNGTTTSSNVTGKKAFEGNAEKLTGFAVFKNQVISIAEDVWNKIVGFLTGQTPEPETAAETPLPYVNADDVMLDEQADGLISKPQELAETSSADSQADPVQVVNSEADKTDAIPMQKQVQSLSDAPNIQLVSTNISSNKNLQLIDIKPPVTSFDSVNDEVLSDDTAVEKSDLDNQEIPDLETESGYVRNMTDVLSALGAEDVVKNEYGIQYTINGQTYNCGNSMDELQSVISELKSSGVEIPEKYQQYVKAEGVDDTAPVVNSKTHEDAVTQSQVIKKDSAEPKTVEPLIGSEAPFTQETLNLMGRQYQHKTHLLDVAQNYLGIQEVTQKEFNSLTPEQKQKTQRALIPQSSSITDQWCAHSVSTIAKESGIDIGGHKAQVQQFIDWAKEDYKSINTQKISSQNLASERAARREQIEKQLPDMNEGDFIIWKTSYGYGSPLNITSSSHIGIIEFVDVNNRTVTVLEGNANEYSRDANGDRMLAETAAQARNGAQIAGREPQEMNRRDGYIRKVYTLDELANYGYSGYIDNSSRIV